MPIWLEWIFFIFLMLILGIPHGAADHLVFFANHEDNKKTSKNWLQFYSLYLGTMLGYALAWWLMPMFCFVIFLIFSAYHFGQSQLYYLATKENTFLKSILYFCWGMGLLSGLLAIHHTQTFAILQDTPFVSLIQLLFNWIFPLQLLFWTITFTLLLGMYGKGNIRLMDILQEAVLLMLLFLLFIQTTLLWSFAMYFALWHSLQTITQEIKVFRQSIQPTYSWKNYILDVLPFSLISFVGIGLILTALYFYEFQQANLLFIFFVLISILTAPHALLMERIYWVEME